MPPDQIYVQNTLFLGRIEEQKQFRAVITEVLEAPKGEELPYILLLFGDGGMGKTTLANRFRDIVRTEKGFQGQLQVLWVDWEDERRRYVALQVGRENISPETVFDVIHANAVNQYLGKHFGAYQDAVKKRAEIENGVAEALSAVNKSDTFAPLRAASAGAIAKVLRVTLPIGEAGEKVAQAFLDAGIKIGAEQAASVRATLENLLRVRLGVKQYDLFLSPNEQLARALGEGLKNFAKGKPLIVFLDTYEIVDRADVWLRTVMRAAGPRVVWIISGRDNLVKSRQFGTEYFKGYADDFPRRVLAYDMHQLAEQDIRALFAECAPSRPLDKEVVEALSRATRGVPLAVNEAAEMWEKGVALVDIVGDVDEALPRTQIIQKMTARYLLHVVAKADRIAIFALALAHGDVEILRAMIYPADVTGFDLDAVLRRLERDYASVYYKSSEEYQSPRLHDEPALFVREFLKDDVQRNEEHIRILNQRAIELLLVRLKKLEADLPSIEERCEDDDWIKNALYLTEHLFWLDESEGWRWLIPRFVESLVYSSQLRRGLLQAVNSWDNWLTKGGKKRLKILRNAENRFSSTEENISLFEELTRLEELGWLKGAGEQERAAILDYEVGTLLYRSEKYIQALDQLERAKQRIPGDCPSLKRQLGKAFEDIGWKLGYRETHDGYEPLPVVAAERAYNEAIACGNKTDNSLRRLGRIQTKLGKLAQALQNYLESVELGSHDIQNYSALGSLYIDLERDEEALAAFQRAIELNPEAAIAHNDLGALYVSLGKYEEALPALQRAIELDPKLAVAHSGLGALYVNHGKYEEALPALQRAIELDPEFASAHNGLGVLYINLDKYEEALPALQRAIELDPKAGRFYAALFVVLASLGHYEEASNLIERATHVDLKEVRLPLGKKELFESILSRLVQIGSTTETPEICVIGIPNLLIAGKADVAFSLFRRILKIDPAYFDNLDALVDTSDPLWMDVAECILELRSVITEFAPLNKSQRRYLATILRIAAESDTANGKYEKALAAFQRSIELDPEAAVAHNDLGALYVNLGKYKEALAAFQRAIELDPSYSSPHTNLAGIYIRRYELDKAWYELNESIRLDPEDSFSPLVSLGIIARHQGLASSSEFFVKAQIKWETARRLRESAAVLLERKAILLLCLGRKDEAMETLKQAIEKRSPGHIFDSKIYLLLQSAPVPPDGYGEMMNLLKEANKNRERQ